jgi:hypothetical protein
MTGTNLYLFCRPTAEAEYERTYTPIAEPSNPDTITLLNDWKKADANGGFVVGRDVPSRALATILRDLILFEPVPDNLNFRVRLAGTVCIGHYGMDITGKLMSELFDAPTFEFNVRSGWKVIQTAKPSLFAAELTRLGIVLHHYEIALLPVWSPDRSNRWLLCGVFRFD